MDQWVGYEFWMPEQVGVDGREGKERIIRRAAITNRKSTVRNKNLARTLGPPLLVSPISCNSLPASNISYIHEELF